MKELKENSEIFKRMHKKLKQDEQVYRTCAMQSKQKDDLKDGRGNIWEKELVLIDHTITSF